MTNFIIGLLVGNVFGWIGCLFWLGPPRNLDSYRRGFRDAVALAERTFKP